MTDTTLLINCKLLAFPHPLPRRSLLLPPDDATILLNVVKEAISLSSAAIKSTGYMYLLLVRSALEIIIFISDRFTSSQSQAASFRSLHQ
ncbi:MAG: hypothetical protein F6K10_19220 [Moorea sp. SIO2B7]|nr:hypothetical protein [Moorena sp. SIO2B7]